jgi:hypothetical protein
MHDTLKKNVSFQENMSIIVTSSSLSVSVKGAMSIIVRSQLAVLSALCRGIDQNHKIVLS